MFLRNSRGQALIESIAAFPLLFIFVSVLVAMLALAGLRIHLIHVTRELATCSQTDQKISLCRQRWQKKAERALTIWGVRHVRVWTQTRQNRGFLQVQGEIGAWKLRWYFEEESPVRFL